MTIHKEGRKFLAITLFIFVVLIAAFWYLYPNFQPYTKTVAIGLAFFYIFFVHFFIKPGFTVDVSENEIVAPADGKIVVIEEINENEYLKDKRIQLSIFMSIWDFHVNWVPMPGVVSYYKYHPGQFLVARNPKSSELNEMASVAIKTKAGPEIMVRQIAGFVARRVRTYIKPGQDVVNNEEVGFIKFGSRVDIMLPVDSKLNVEVGDKVKGNQTILGYIND